MSAGSTSAAPVLDVPLEGLATIGLAELTERASLLTRIDRKYVLPRAELDAVLGDLDPAVRVLDIDGVRSSAYESVYFDTPELTSFLMAAHPRRRRFKIRTRTYVDSAQSYLEVKTRGGRGVTRVVGTPTTCSTKPTSRPRRGRNSCQP